jgi:hypothetical protein
MGKIRNMLSLSQPLLDAIATRLNIAAPRAVKIRLRLLAPDCLEVRVRRRWPRRSWGGGRVLLGEDTAREALIDAIDIAAQETSHLVGRPWPPGSTEDDEPHLAEEKNAIRIWFGNSRSPLLTLDLIPLSHLPTP